MKRAVCLLLACLMAVGFPLTASATVMTQVTDYDYASVKTGGKDNTIVYTAHEDSGAFVMGTLTAAGEQTRTAHTLDGWDALFDEPTWTVTYHGDGTPLCPYGDTHGANTVCPYNELSQVTLTNTVTGVTVANRFIPSGVSQVLPGGTVHFCFGRYGYEAAETLRWDGTSRYMALKNDDGLWGVFDTATAAMATGYDYADISAVYGQYAKVFDGAKWGRLDLSGGFVTRYVYDGADAFSVRDEVRQTADGVWQIFNRDNEAISPAVSGDFREAVYIPEAATLLVTNSDKTKTMYDIDGNVTASFAATDEVVWLQDTCFAVSRYTESGALRGIALYRADDVTTAASRLTKGDVNVDGAVNSEDARAVLRAVLGYGALTALQQAAADVTDNGTVDTADVREILRLATA